MNGRAQRFRADVAQICNLLYRRIASCEVSARSRVLDLAGAWPITNRRYGRVQLCATGKRLLGATLWSPALKRPEGRAPRQSFVEGMRSAHGSLGTPLFALAVAGFLFLHPAAEAEITNTAPTAKNLNQTAARGEFSHLLQFLDGASVHGRLRSMDTNQGVQWEHPAAKNLIQFQPAGIASIKFENAQRVNAESKPTCWFRFGNGDEVFGSMKSLDAEKLRLETWFGGDLEAPRDALQSITFFPKGFAILYEGPSGPDGWIMTQGPKGWRYKDGAFVANSVGILGRNLGLSGSCSLEFDLSWSGHFSLSFILFTDAVDRFDYSVSSYMFHMAPGYVNLQRVQTGTGVMSLGHQAQIPDMLKKNKVHIEIRANRDDATIALLMARPETTMDAASVCHHFSARASSALSVRNCRAISRAMASPTVTSAAATVITKKTINWPPTSFQARA